MTEQVELVHSQAEQEKRETLNAMAVMAVPLVVQYGHHVIEGHYSTIGIVTGAVGAIAAYKRRLFNR